MANDNATHQYSVQEIFNLAFNPATNTISTSGGGGGGSVTIGGAVTGGTPNSVLFINASGNLGQDNNQFYFNDTASGTASPVQLSVATGGDFTGTNSINIYGQLDAYNPNSVVNGGSGQVANLLLDGITPGISLSSSRGTGTVPTVLAGGDFIGGVLAYGYTGASPAYTNVASIIASAQGVGTTLGGQLDFYTGADAGTLTKRWTIDNVGGLTGTSASATSFVVGPNGATNPVLQIDSSVASAVNGIQIQGTASGSGVNLSVISSAASDGLRIASKGTTSTILLQPNGATRISLSQNSFIYTPTTNTSAATVRFSVTNAADTSLTASSESTYVYYNLGSGARSHSTGNITLQRDFRITGSVHAFGGASTITDLAAFSVDYGDATTNASVTNLHALYIPTKALAGAAITNSYGINVTAATGATNNYAAALVGNTALVGVGVGLGGGSGIVSIANATTAPTSNPTLGGFQYSVSGALTWRGSSGTVTTIAPA